MKNIVVGVSDAPTSRAAGQRAFELAALTGATVHVVSAVANPESTTVEIGSDSFHLDELDTTEHDIESWIRSLGTNVPWHVRAVDGKPADSLIEVAEAVGADLIVVGNVRMQGFGRMFGSVGNDVTHHAPCDVLVVKTV